MRNRMHLVQSSAGARTVTILVNPTDPQRSAAAPYFARLEERYGTAARRLLSTFHTTIPDALAAWGIAPETIDYVTYDHLHVQDVRGLLAPGPGGRAFLPNAKLLVQKAELDTLAQHPSAAGRVVHPRLSDRRAGRSDRRARRRFLIGGGFAIVRTPGHTWGNHTLVDRHRTGAWTVSENGVCVDAYAPGVSRIRGIAKHARDAGVDVILNANTREGSLDQYTSMVLEKTLADGVPERPEWPQHFSSSEMVPHLLAPGLTPTYTHGAITHGEIAARAAAAYAQGA